MNLKIKKVFSSNVDRPKIRSFKHLVFSDYYHALIVKKITKHYKIKPEEMFTKSRKSKIICGKRMYISIARNMFGLTLQEIAKLTNLHHASVIHHNRKFAFLFSFYQEENELYKNIEMSILEAKLDEAIESVKDEVKKLNLKLTRLYNIKKEKNGKKREKLFTK